MARSSILPFKMRRDKLSRPAALVIALSLIALNLCGQAHPTARQSHATQDLTPDDIFKKVSHSVFVVEAVNLHGEVVLQENGVAISQHVIASSKNILESVANPGPSHHDDDWIARYRIRQGYRTWNVNRVFVDSQRDLSTFESVDLDSSPVQLRRSDSLSVGERVYAISYPKGQAQTLTQGFISVLHGSNKANIIKTSVSLGVESAGSGLFDSHGKLAGIIVFDELESLNSALPTEWLRYPSVLFSGKQRSDETRVDHQKLWDSTALLENNLQSFAFYALAGKKIKTDPTGQESHNIIYHSDDDNAATIRLSDSIFLPEDSPEKFDNWPAWRQSAGYMEQLRSVMMTASKNGATDDGIVRTYIDEGRKLWSDILDLYCHELPSAPYTDLEGKARACPQAQ